MNEERSVVDYDELFQAPVGERLNIFRQISAEDRASIVKTQSDRWLAANRSRLSGDQVAAVEEMMEAISPEWYKTDRDVEIDPDVEALIKKVEGVLTRGDMSQLATYRADYIPPLTNDGNDE